jgi:hypothetical protein
VWLFFSAYKTPTQPAITFESAMINGDGVHGTKCSLDSKHIASAASRRQLVPPYQLTTASNSAPALAANRQLGETVLWFVHE